MSRPIAPQRPREPSRPEEFVRRQVRIVIDGAKYDVELDIDPDDAWYSKLDYLSVDPKSLGKLIMTLDEIDRRGDVPLSEIGVTFFDGNVCLSYDVNERHPEYDAMLATYEANMARYKVQLVEYDQAMSKYYDECDEYARKALEEQIKTAQERLAELLTRKR